MWAYCTYCHTNDKSEADLVSAKRIIEDILQSFPFPILMKFSVSSLVGWICTALVGALNIFAGVMKFMPVDPASEQAKMMADMGMTPGLEHALGVIELTITLLYIIPRTSTVGFVLMVGYFGGVTATLLTHGQDATFAYVILAVLTVGAYFRNPELLTRLRKGSI